MGTGGERREGRGTNGRSEETARGTASTRWSEGCAGAIHRVPGSCGRAAGSPCPYRRYRWMSSSAPHGFTLTLTPSWRVRTCREIRVLPARLWQRTRLTQRPALTEAPLALITALLSGAGLQAGVVPLQVCPSSDSPGPVLSS